MADFAPFPHHYKVTFHADQLTGGPRTPIAAGAPPQFGGVDTVWSPEDLFVGATLLCLKTTFDSFARRNSLTVHGWLGNGTGVLEKTSNGIVFTSINLEVELKVPAGDEERAQKLLETAERHCIISNAIKAPVHLQASVIGVGSTLVSSNA